MKKINYYLCCFFMLTVFSSRTLSAYMSYEIYVEDWQCSACVGDGSCGSCWPTCKFAWNSNTICTLAFAGYGYNTGNPNDGVVYGLVETAAMLTATANLVHNAGGKIKISYGGGTGGYQLWNVANWQDSNVIYAVAQNMSSACVGYGLDGIDIDFEGAPPAGGGAAVAQLIKNLRNLLGSGKLITITMPAQVIGGVPSNISSNPAPAQRTWASYIEFHALLDNLSKADGTIDFTLINHINFMEYCFGISPGNNQTQQAISDIQSYHNGFYQIPYGNMALGMEQYCCGVTSCATGEFAMDANTAASVATWANNNGLAGVFFWDLTKELEYFTPNLCTIPDAINQAFPVSYAIRYVCGQPPARQQVNGLFQQLSVSASNTNPQLGFDLSNRNDNLAQPQNGSVIQP